MFRRLAYIIHYLSAPKYLRKSDNVRGLPFPQGQKRGKRTWRD